MHTATVSTCAHSTHTVSTSPHILGLCGCCAVPAPTPLTPHQHHTYWACRQHHHRSTTPPTCQLCPAHASSECCQLSIVDVVADGLLPQVHLDALQATLVVWPTHLNGAVKPAGAGCLDGEWVEGVRAGCCTQQTAFLHTSYGMHWPQHWYTTYNRDVTQRSNRLPARSCECSIQHILPVGSTHDHNTWVCIQQQHKQHSRVRQLSHAQLLQHICHTNTNIPVYITLSCCTRCS